jgi:hypothetical protein
LRKKVKVFMQKNYTENFVQVDTLTIIRGGADGRLFSKLFLPRGLRVQRSLSAEMVATITRK